MIKLFITEEGSRRAVLAVKKADRLLAPDLIWPEAANVLWKYVQRGELDSNIARSLLRDMQHLPVIVTPSRDLIEPAFAIATQTGRTVYDSVYLALAVQQAAVMLTADHRLVNALAHLRVGKFIRGL